MNERELQLILEEGEGYKIEFKESLNNLDKEMVAFANSSGGRIFLGITDAGKVKGVSITNDLKSRIQDMANNCTPKIKISFDVVDSVFIINIKEGEDKPYECSSGFYKRIGPNSQKMRRDELLAFFRSEGKIRFDELIEPKFSFSRDFDKNRFKRFLQPYHCRFIF
ncbi:MAG: ATP-binding protein [Thermodesulfovibrionales bacterium]